jgi:capsid portal protein
MREQFPQQIITGYGMSPSDPSELIEFQNQYIQKSEISRVRSMAFERRQRLPYLITKGLAKPGTIGFDILRRAATSVHVARICVNALKEQITKTSWVIKDKNPQRKTDDKLIDVVQNLFLHPNHNNETFRTLLDKILEDLLVIDWVGIEKTRFDDGSGQLAELHYVDAATIRPIYDDHGNQDVLISITNQGGETNEIPVSYVQVLDSNPYGGRESGQVVAVWPKKDFISFSQHPQGSMGMFGYGLSPLEAVIGVVANILNADNFNGTYFEEGSFPPVIIHLKANMNERELQAAREYMYQELEGHYNRPMIIGGEGDMDIENLKDLTQRDMQFMDYMTFMATLLAAAYGLSKQDIGLADGMNRSTSEVQKDLSQAKGYGSILDLLKEVFNDQIILSDFGEIDDRYKEIEFEWVAPDTTDPATLSDVIDKKLRNGTITINQAREMAGDQRFVGDWADQPAILASDGTYIPLDPEKAAEFQQKKAEQQQVATPNLFGRNNNDDGQRDGDKPDFGKQPKKINGEGDQRQPATEKSIVVEKSIQTDDGLYQVYVDDRGVGQPFIFYDLISHQGRVIKPTKAVALDSQQVEEYWTQKLFNERLPVVPVKQVGRKDVLDFVLPTDQLVEQFKSYENMEPAYDSIKFSAKFGHSRRSDVYLVSKYVEGRNLRDNLLIDDMKRVPKEYYGAIDQLAKLWLAEKKYIIGDRRADQYLVTPAKRVWGFDYQFIGNQNRWNGTKNAISQALVAIPELQKRFLEKTGQNIIQKNNKFSEIIKGWLK